MITSRELKKHHVTKLNSVGARQRRVVVVDASTASLWNFTASMQLKKQIPLTQLVQVTRCVGPLCRA